ncbi:clathrin light chain [Saccharomyces cerevisiae]|nr:Clc1p [Saccharomyces cerevisiae YJM1388]CAI4494029.1 ALH_1c_G0021810.mRNA.1.CDS.1 [Saccharomyces cerevisiae]CAI4509516.1 CEL_1a_G0021900.mRNA.1.CDS.1 [Saccharomyces cerevisiae]CAI4512429.1 ALH_1b_G0021870.mRNA.1.CDS.1 [Saccharomyces cerevisiae]CAI5274009.1 AKR_HP2_G0021390.mRNA.1.CDS.1 [Saccharomyces cerevisiae]
MSEKFPPLEDQNIDFTPNDKKDDDTDFLKREAEILGDEFKTEQDDILETEASPAKDDDEIRDFKEQFPDINSANGAVSSDQNGSATVPSGNDNGEADDDFSTFEGAPANQSTESVKEDRSEVVDQWKQRRAVEIHEKDLKDEELKKELQDEAIKHIDDFYDSYNKKKEQQLEDAAKEAEAFLKKRDEFFGQDNTTWDRALQLINQDDADIIGGRDRSKFKEILLRLKGNAKAPGA